MHDAAGEILETRVPARLDRLPWGRFHTLVGPKVPVYRYRASGQNSGERIIDAGHMRRTSFGAGCNDSTPAF
jgi:hypothetical protein